MAELFIDELWKELKIVWELESLRSGAFNQEMVLCLAAKL